MDDLVLKITSHIWLVEITICRCKPYHDSSWNSMCLNQQRTKIITFPGTLICPNWCLQTTSSSCLSVSNRPIFMVVWYKGFFLVKFHIVFCCSSPFPVALALLILKTPSFNFREISMLLWLKHIKIMTHHSSSWKIRSLKSSIHKNHHVHRSHHHFPLICLETSFFIIFPPDLPRFSNVFPCRFSLGRQPCGRGLPQRRHRGVRQGHALGEGAAQSPAPRAGRSRIWWHVDFLVGGLEHLIFHILAIVTPNDFHIFQRGWNHQPVLMMVDI